MAERKVMPIQSTAFESITIWGGKPSVAWSDSENLTQAADALYEFLLPLDELLGWETSDFCKMVNLWSEKACEGCDVAPVENFVDTETEMTRAVIDVTLEKIRTGGDEEFITDRYATSSGRQLTIHFR